MKRCSMLNITYYIPNGFKVNRMPGISTQPMHALEAVPAEAEAETVVVPPGNDKSENAVNTTEAFSDDRTTVDATDQPETSPATQEDPNVNFHAVETSLAVPDLVEAAASTEQPAATFDWVKESAAITKACAFTIGIKAHAVIHAAAAAIATAKCSGSETGSGLWGANANGDVSSAPSVNPQINATASSASTTTELAGLAINPERVAMIGNTPLSNEPEPTKFAQFNPSLGPMQSGSNCMPLGKKTNPPTTDTIEAPSVMNKVASPAINPARKAMMEKAPLASEPPKLARFDKRLGPMQSGSNSMPLGVRKASGASMSDPVVPTPALYDGIPTANPVPAAAQDYTSNPTQAAARAARYSARNAKKAAIQDLKQTILAPVAAQQPLPVPKKRKLTKAQRKALQGGTAQYRHLSMEQDVWAAVHKRVTKAVTDTQAVGKPFNDPTKKAEVTARVNVVLGILKGLILGEGNGLILSEGNEMGDGMVIKTEPGDA
jgi:hypothetical protein